MNISHLRKMFRDLFERQGFVDDGEYDWEVVRKQCKRDRSNL